MSLTRPCTDAAKVARRLAAQKWGEVCTQRKAAPGIWWFSCSGHGGYIVDTDVHPEAAVICGKDYTDTVYARYSTAHWDGRYWPSEQHFACFEEDADWAVCEALFLMKHPAGFRKPFGKKGPEDDETWARERLERLVVPTLAKWHPEIGCVQAAAAGLR